MGGTALPAFEIGDDAVHDGLGRDENFGGLPEV